MSTVTEITKALPELNDQELRSVERALISIYRQRGSGIIHDDDYGVWTEEDQRLVADQAFVLMDAEGKRRNKAGEP